ncbi:hypothetical protein A3E42_04115 [Candidatus Gottesmanbacteria bacterium RIFCSPHIGHO2_12_FULL_40_13]|nr:MAG: hypothetical protein A3E42_04115 [Candidatus Gottesmanbacteria bacterium RIFCSPHIGHO2_12_FULL_40_13]
MTPRDSLAYFSGKAVHKTGKYLKIGYGGTWPGEIALKISPGILKRLSKSVGIGTVLVAGTNGKTTTSLMLKSILQRNGNTVIHNSSGANLINGVVSSFIINGSFFKPKPSDYAVFETDENTLPVLLKEITPAAVICLNLFRDQLDRYGEVDVIAEKWERALKLLPGSSSVILNADDPQIAYLGTGLKAKTVYFGINNRKLFINGIEHATDSLFCLKCHHRLSFEGVYYSHIGLWYCRFCKLKRPRPDFSTSPSPLPGFYNRYNSLAAFACALNLGIKNDTARQALSSFAPAFGRQEEFFREGKKIKIFLSKNPAGFNESIKTITGLGARAILVMLNDRIPDGRDVSWIWDVDFEKINPNIDVTVSGDRVFDLALRLDYADKKFQYAQKAEDALKTALSKMKNKETLFVLPTYTAMLELRKILTGRKIL